MLITDTSNNNISNKSLAEYSSMIPASANLTNVGFSSTNIDCNSSDNDKIKVLKDRFKNLESTLKYHIGVLTNIN